MTVHIGPYEFDDIDYDAEGDVLYLSVGEPQPAADSEETPEGHIVRYDEHDRVIGVTIVGARDLLGQDGGVSLTLPRRSVTADPSELAAALAAADGPAQPRRVRAGLEQMSAVWLDKPDNPAMSGPTCAATTSTERLRGELR